MVGPYRWELVQTIQPVIVVAEQAPAELQSRKAIVANAQTPAGGKAGVGISNPDDSGVIVTVDSIVPIAGFVTPAFELRRNTAAPSGSGLLEAWADTRTPGAPAADTRINAVANGDIIGYLESNADQGARAPVQPLYVLAPGNTLQCIMSATGTGTAWFTIYWTERPLE